MRRGGAPALVVLALLALAAEAAAVTSFAPPTVLATVPATFVAVGDLNADGHQDIVALDTVGGLAATVLLNNGIGRFPTRIDLALPIVTRWLGIGQFTGSAAKDLVLVGDDGAIRVLTGNGSGGFQDSGIAVALAVGSGGFAGGAIGDLRGLGRDDLVVAFAAGGMVGNLVYRLFRATAGGFEAEVVVDQFPGGSGLINGIALADLTGEGGPDLLVHLTSTGAACATGRFAFASAVRVLRNDGSGGLIDTKAFSTGAQANASIAMGDMNGDGRPDLVTASQNQCPSISSKVTVLVNSGSSAGNWLGFLAASTVATPTGQDVWALDVGDVDGDGHRDVITQGISTSSLSRAWFLRAHSRIFGTLPTPFDGTFSGPEDRPFGLLQQAPPPANLVVADLDGDGKPDVLVPVDAIAPTPPNFPDGVAVFFNTATYPAQGGSARLSVVPIGNGTGSVTSANPAGIACGGAGTACSLLLPVGPPAPTVTLSAAAAAGSTFTGWTGGGCAGTAPCVVTLDASKTVVASFVLTSELNAPAEASGWSTVGVTVSFINVGTPAFNAQVFGPGNAYTETSVVKLNGVNQATTPLFSGSGSSLEAFVPYAAVPAGPQSTTITVLNGLPSGPFSLSPPFPFHAIKACRGVPDPCTTAVTAVPSPANASALAFTLHATASSNGVFFGMRINGVERPTVVDNATCTPTSCKATISVPFADIVAAGTLMLSNTNASNPAVGTMTIRPPVQIAVGSPLPGGTVNGGYSRTITATGGSATKSWAVTAGALPPGLTLGAGTGVLSGTPTQAGTFEFTVTVTDEDFPAAKAVQAYALTIAPALLITTGSPLAASTQGVAYAQVTLQATGGTGSRTWSVSAGALPAGMTLSGAGVVSGTPTASGTFNFTAKVTDAAGAFVTKAFALTINAPLSVTTSSLPGGTKGAVYPTQTLAATGGTGGRTWTISAGALPGGLTLSAGGSISGTPTGVGTFAFTVRVTDGVGATATKGLSIAIAADTAGPAVTIQSPAPPKGSATSTPLLVSGVASDNVGVTQVSWANDRGGSGGASGTTAWVASGIPLQPGKNVITITARDAANNAGTAQVAIYFFQDTLSAGATPIKAVHFLQLATAIENLRTRLGVPGSPAFAWAGATPGVGGPVRASQLNDLRGALGTLYDHAGVAVGTTFTRTPIAAGARIDAAHVAELRAGIRALP